MRADVAVIGGGISGLAAAYEAQKTGASVIVLEAAEGFGGVMQTDNVGGFLVERGPTSMAATEHSERLLHELGLAADIVRPDDRAKRRFVLRDGMLHTLPSSPVSLIKSELLSANGKLRLLVEPFVRRGGDDREESLAELVSRRFGQEVLEYLVDPFVSGVCAGDPARLSSRHVLRVIGELEQQYGSVLRGAIQRARASKGKSSGSIISLRHGMRQLPAALQSALSGSCVSDARVTAVETDNQRVRLACNIGGIRETVQADAIVCALPSHAIAGIKWPEPWQSDLSRMAQVSYAPIATVALGFRREQIAHGLDGFGALFPSAEKREILGVLFNSSMFEGRAPTGRVLATAFVGGARHSSSNPTSDNGTLSADACGQAALRELIPLLGISCAPEMTSVAVWQSGIPQLEVQHQSVLTAASAIENRAFNVFFTGSYLSGASIGDCLAHGHDAGRRAAVRATRTRTHVENILAQPIGAPL